MVIAEVAVTLDGRLNRQPRSGPRVTHHAVVRYIERVEPSATGYQAEVEIDLIVHRGHVRSTPRHWMRRVRQTPGLRYIYWAELPDVCALVRDDAVVTIITRRLCRQTWYPLTPGEVVEPIYCGSADEARTFEYDVAA